MNNIIYEQHHPRDHSLCTTDREYIHSVVHDVHCYYYHDVEEQYAVHAISHVVYVEVESM
jgi:hypothetical protein